MADKKKSDPKKSTGPAESSGTPKKGSSAGPKTRANQDTGPLVQDGWTDIGPELDPESVWLHVSEPEPEPEPEPVIKTKKPASTPAPQPERIVERRGGFGSALLGGMVAAAIGFMAAKSDVLDSFLPASMRSVDLSTELSALQSGQADLSSTVAALNEQLAAAKAPDLSEVTAQIADLTNRLEPLAASVSSATDGLTDLQAQLGDLSNRTSALEKRPVTDNASAEAIAAYEKELSDLQAALATQRQEVEKMVSDAQALDAASAEAARIAQAQTMVARLRADLDGGLSIAPVVDELKSIDVDVPTALEEAADSGVATIGKLQEDYVPAARQALAAARTETASGSGLMAYVQRHLGARSVTPREGDDPDAILSRVEAALSSGDLETALNEVSTLPDAALQALQGWEAAAKMRQMAIVATDELAKSLNTN